MSDWSPDVYLKFADERSRPAAELLSRVPLSSPRIVYDLGCGPGNSTALLRRAYPQARLIGLDHSPAMLERARRDLPGIQFINVDLRNWQAEEGADLLFANATFQWVASHEMLLQSLLQKLAPGAVLAVQMPDNLAEPSHALMRDLASDRLFNRYLADAASSRENILSARGYADILEPYCKNFQIWRTTYYHRLSSPAAIVDFVSSTGLRPFVDPLPESLRAGFLDMYQKVLTKAYPACASGTILFPFPRLFMVAERG